MEILTFEEKIAQSLQLIYKQIKTIHKTPTGVNKKKIAVALSGGADSLSLVFALKKINIDITALHFNHSIREESDQEELYLQSLMKQHNIHFISEKWRGENLKNENLARQKRYEYLIQKCTELNINFLCTAHHADDQVETFLINLSRGSSLDGLTAMKSFNLIKEKSSINKALFLMRPLLKLSKIECINFVNLNSIVYCEDKSNQDRKFLRNNIRYLLTQLNDYDLIKKRILNCIENLQNARFFIDKTIEKSIKNITKIEKKHLKQAQELEKKMHNKNITEFKIFSLKKFLRLTFYEKYNILNNFISFYENKEYKIRKSFLDILITDFENKNKKDLIKRNLQKTHISIYFKRNLAIIYQTL